MSPHRSIPGLGLSLCVLASLGCGPSAAPEAPTPEAPVFTPEELAPPAPPANDSPYGTDGELLPSGVVVAGLALPKGLTLVREEARLHVYDAQVPLEKVLRWFGPRLLTGDVQRVGAGAIYRGAQPRDASGGVVTLEVSILPSSSALARVEVRELPPPPATPPTEDDVRRALRELNERAE